MIVIRVLLQVRQELLPAFRAHAASEGVAARSKPGCAEYAFFEDVGSPGRFVLYEEWESQEAFDAYKASPEFELNGRVVFPMLDGKPSSAYYEASRFGPG